MDKKIELLRAALNDAEIGTILRAVRIALEEKQKSIGWASELGIRLSTDDLGIPAPQAIQARLQAAYEMEERTA